MRKPIYKQAEMTADNDIYRGESIEEYCNKATTSNQPIEGGAPLIFTARKNGVLEEYNIRTDRWKIAQRAMDKASKSIEAKRNEYIKKTETTKTETEINTEGIA